MTDILERLKKEADYEAQFKGAEKWHTSMNKKTHDMCNDAISEINSLKDALASAATLLRRSRDLIDTIDYAQPDPESEALLKELNLFIQDEDHAA